MKAAADAVLDLPGLCPGTASLAALTRPDAASAWDTLRTDPAVVVLLLGHVSSQASSLPTSLFDDLQVDSLLIAAQEMLRRPEYTFVDWRQAGASVVCRTALRQAALAEALALRLDRPALVAWVAGLLTPLGWFGVCAAEPGLISESVERIAQGGAAAQHQAWGLDHTSTRRLARAWRLPAWITAIVGNLGLHADLAQRLGADPHVFRIVQLAVLGTQRHGEGLNIPVGTTAADLLRELRLSEEQYEACTAGVTMPVLPALEAPRQQPLLADVLRLALENRVRADRGLVERLSHDLDRVHDALDVQFTQEQVRLRQQKLAALAELAAGAGHEINNPLAVISGQAQYLLKQLQTAEEQLIEDPSPSLYVDTLKVKFGKALQTIVGQTQRIHQVLTDLMHFARPQPPRSQAVPVTKLLADVASGIRPLAEERSVRLVCPEASGSLAVCIDPVQVRTALFNLLKNAVEAAPADGWASLRVEREPDGGLLFVIEDNGPGLSAAAREHLFDPFYSGRSAGRGRGLGLPTAWRLARQHGGDIRHDASAQGVTRFYLSLPADLIETVGPSGNGHAHSPVAGNGRVATAEVELLARN